MTSDFKHMTIQKNMQFALDWKFHFIFWSVMQIYFFYTMDFFNVPFDRMLNSKLFYLPLQLMAAYFAFYVLLGRYLYKGKYIKAIVGFVIFIFAFSYLAYFFNHFMYQPYIRGNLVGDGEAFEMIGLEDLIFEYMRVIFLSPLILICLEFGVAQYRKMKDVELLIRQKRKAELNLLKTQIHPGFLLSTLRNLEQLAEQEDEDGPVVIEHLSETLDYILYKGRLEYIELSKEIEAITNYVALENIRFKGVATIHLDGQLDTSTIQISPLVLFSFLELNFKNYSKETIPFYSSVIHCENREGELICTITNKKNPQKAENKIDFEILEFQRQLDITYAEKHTLDVVENKDIYQIVLTLKL